MKQFEYIIKDKLGLHARPCGLLVKKAASFQSSITVTIQGKTADAKKLFMMMGLCAKYNDIISFTIEGSDEDTAAEQLKDFCEENF